MTLKTSELLVKDTPISSTFDKKKEKVSLILPAKSLLTGPMKGAFGFPTNFEWKNDPTVITLAGTGSIIFRKWITFCRTSAPWSRGISLESPVI